MSAGALLWTRVAASVTVAALLLVVLGPPVPPRRAPAALALAAGVAAGGLLFAVVVRRTPRLPRRRPFVLVAGRQAYLGLRAASEEVVWRCVVLGELLALGSLPALAVSTLGFSLAHRGRRGVHVVSGAAFGGVYLGTGALLASIAAHWSYNALVALSLERSAGETREPGEPRAP